METHGWDKSLGWDECEELGVGEKFVVPMAPHFFCDSYHGCSNF